MTRSFAKAIDCLNLSSLFSSARSKTKMMLRLGENESEIDFPGVAGLRSTGMFSLVCRSLLKAPFKSDGCKGSKKTKVVYSLSLFI